MNAHAPRRDRIAREVAPPRGVVRCAAEDIGRQIEAAFCELATLQDDLPGEPGAGWSNLVADQLRDRLHALRQQLQWVTAASLAGVHAQSCELRRLTEAGPVDILNPAGRGVARLSALIDNSLRAIGGFGEFDFGGSSEVSIPDGFADVLFRHTHQDIRAA